MQCLWRPEEGGRCAELEFMKVVHHLLWMLEPNPPGGTTTLSPVLTVPFSVSSDVLPLENQKHKANKAHLMKREGF